MVLNKVKPLLILNKTYLIPYQQKSIFFPLSTDPLHSFFSLSLFPLEFPLRHPFMSQVFALKAHFR